ncbi:hypothetical protein LY76DRAFT_604241 [Colletotrichum caudatum]|nr:hypothetical protein LY76DRAFT_604241 [Colletotrichum caudatum]
MLMLLAMQFTCPPNFSFSPSAATPMTEYLFPRGELSAYASNTWATLVADHFKGSSHWEAALQCLTFCSCGFWYLMHVQKPINSVPKGSSNGLDTFPMDYLGLKFDRNMLRKYTKLDHHP